MNAILEYAIKNIWCSPNIDNPSILAPARLTGPEAATNQFFLFNQAITLPVMGVLTHIYNLGSRFPLLINLQPIQYQWIPLSSVANWENTTINLYDDNGINLSLSNSYYLITKTGNILLAVLNIPNIPTTFGNPVYIRTYQNAYFDTPGFETNVPLSSAANKIVQLGGTMNTVDDIAALHNQYLALPSVGAMVFFKNGYVVPSINTSNTSIGDVAEVVYDPSIYKVRDFPINVCPTFTSLLDTVGKFLLHYTDSGMGEFIDFSGDIDAYILDATTLVGVYFHKNSVTNLRNVTHRDYSANVASVAALLNDPAGLINPSNAIIRLYIREGAYQRPLVNEANQLRELYKLPDAEVSRALLGINSTVSNWRADNLENGAYVSIMPSTYQGITIDTTQNCFGYDATIKTVADTPLPTQQFSGITVAAVGDAYSGTCDVYEYDQSGHLLDKYVKMPNEIYNCTNQNCSIAEPFLGNGGTMLDEYYNATTVVINPLYDYHVYVSLNGTETTAGQWVDVTDVTPNNFYSITNGIMTLTVDPTIYNSYVLSNAKYLYRKLTLPFDNGILPFNISRLTNINNQSVPSAYVETEVFFPLGVLDVFLNGYQLIENIDYRVVTNSVIIYNKQYANANGNNDVRYRNYALPDTDMSRYPVTEQGFVINNALSVNDEYNIRDSKSVMVTVGGSRVLINNEVTEEQDNYTFTSTINGLPYQIQDAIVPIRNYYNVDSYAFRKYSKVIEGNIDNYLTEYLGITDPITTNPIVSLYNIYSPFISRLLALLVSGNLTLPDMTVNSSANTIATLVSSYMYIYAFDPCNPNNGYNQNYVYCAPHPNSTQLVITANQYLFLTKVIAIYTPTLTLSSFVEVIPNV